MVISYTGAAYFFVSIAAGLLNYRFFQYWQKEKSVVSKCFFFFLTFLFLVSLKNFFVGIFFANNVQVLKASVTAAAFFQAIAGGFAGYLVAHMQFPKISPWVGFLTMFIFGLYSTYLTIVAPYSVVPFLEEPGSINWGSQPTIEVYVVRTAFFFFTLAPLFFVFIGQYKKSKDAFVKKRAVGLSIVIVLVFAQAIFDFVLEGVFGLGAFVGDIAIGALGLSVFLFIFLTQKSPEKEKIKQEDVSSPYHKIQW